MAQGGEVGGASILSVTALSPNHFSITKFVLLSFTRDHSKVDFRCRKMIFGTLRLPAGTLQKLISDTEKVILGTCGCLWGPLQKLISGTVKQCFCTCAGSRRYPKSLFRNRKSTFKGSPNVPEGTQNHFFFTENQLLKGCERDPTGTFSSPKTSFSSFWRGAKGTRQALFHHRKPVFEVSNALRTRC